MNTATMHTNYITIKISKKALFLGAMAVLALAGLLLAGHIAGHIPMAMLAR